ncbi:unnamed protein product [Echinostoma caproni]|uniref:Reverse transcriptase domain-containing protein n=1 Tax=Echinostoma caproni TaxID=27848 RepID=A0A183A677_9TREM|nr:unnamed protein product [Echinostoma caproni]
MGLPLGPLSADIFMAKLENGVLSKPIKEFPFYKRYVDDIICVYDADKDADILLKKFNGAHPKIEFTLEKESTNGLAFLDVLLSRRSDGSILTSIHHKKTWTGQ